MKRQALPRRFTGICNLLMFFLQTCRFTLLRLFTAELASYNTMANLAHHLFLEIRIYWATAKPICLDIVYGSFPAMG